MLALEAVPDVTITPASPEIGFIHRHTKDAEVYFLADTANQRRIREKVAFRVGGMQAQGWDPMTGRVGLAEVAEKTAKTTTVSLTLEPYGSTLIVFTNHTLPVSPKCRQLPSCPLRWT